MPSITRKLAATLVVALALTGCTPAQRALFARHMASRSIERASLTPCGDGEHPPCYVAERESRGQYNARASAGCSGPCWGKWQFDERTWDATVQRMGRPDLIGNYLPCPEDQDAVAAFLWDRGRGCSHWAAC